MSLVLKDAWYAAVRADLLPRGARVARTIAGEPIVIFRDERGRIGALHDRCCHRSAPLSQGFVVGEALACPYHGWHFDASGRCTKIPGVDAERIPERACVRTYQAREQSGLVWICVGAQPRWPLPSSHEIDGLRPVFTSEDDVACDWEHVVENMLDGTHIPVVHARSLDRGAWWKFGWIRRFREEQGDKEPDHVDIEESERGFVASAQMVAKGRVTRLRVELRVPSTVTIDIDMGRSRLHAWVHAAPTTEGRCRVEHVFSRSFLTSPLVDRLFAAQARKVLREDVSIIEKLPRYRSDARDQVSTARDRNPALFRKWLRAADQRTLDQWKAT